MSSKINMDAVANVEQDQRRQGDNEFIPSETELQQDDSVEILETNELEGEELSLDTTEDEYNASDQVKEVQVNDKIVSDVTMEIVGELIRSHDDLGKVLESLNSEEKHSEKSLESYIRCFSESINKTNFKFKLEEDEGIYNVGDEIFAIQTRGEEQIFTHLLEVITVNKEANEVEVQVQEYIEKPLKKESLKGLELADEILHFLDSQKINSHEDNHLEESTNSKVYTEESKKSAYDVEENENVTKI